MSTSISFERESKAVTSREHIFIAFHQTDSIIADQVATGLKASGFTVFLDGEMLVAGEIDSDKVVKELRSSDAAIVVLSQHSKRSGWVEEELVQALRSNQVVIPILVDPEGKNNGVWPLVGDRLPLEWPTRQEDLPQAIDKLKATLTGYLNGLAANPKPTKKTHKSYKRVLYHTIMLT